MSHDPTQDYSHKDLAKITGSLAHNLLAQARLSETSISRLEQEAAALKLQAEEAQRDLALAQSQLDQLETETPHQRRTMDEKDPELQEEVERLQRALTDLHLPHDVYIGADLLIRLKAHVDLINGVIWAPTTSQASAVPVNLENLLSGQTIPEACTLISEQETVIPAYTKGVAVRLNLQCGQTLSHSLGFFQPSPECVELGLTLEATPLVEVTSRAVYILFNNCMAMDVRVPKAYRLGWLVSYDFQDFELVLPVIGPIPVSMIPEGSSSHTVSTVPFKIITILSVVPVVKEQVCRTELTVDQHLAVYTVSSHPSCETDNVTAPPTVHNTEDVKTEEPYPGFETQVQQILRDADALREDADRHKLRHHHLDA
ncbi:olfactory receptor 51B2-like protein [Labeo rohita]|uniref:Olfactory receptor 51B2-like protein n=1 Tax=Labeo rohita TaxID=84645 RepID=A0A498NUW3_LABRO|nr:olfactory receptor 51B2-like protein [Labeo rohita]